MKKFIPAVVALALSVASLSAVAEISNADRYGKSSSAGVATRTINIDTNTRWANVNHGEIVKFESSGKEFSWHFDGMQSQVSMKQIAPQGFIVRDLLVYIGPDSLQQSGE